jgi:hypothetical protein
MAFDGLEFKWTAEVFGTHNAHMDEEHQGKRLQSLRNGFMI